MTFCIHMFVKYTVSCVQNDWREQYNTFTRWIQVYVQNGWLIQINCTLLAHCCLYCPHNEVCGPTYWILASISDLRAWFSLYLSSSSCLLFASICSKRCSSSKRSLNAVDSIWICFWWKRPTRASKLRSVCLGVMCFNRCKHYYCNKQSDYEMKKKNHMYLVTILNELKQYNWHSRLANNCMQLHIKENKYSDALSLALK